LRPDYHLNYITRVEKHSSKRVGGGLGLTGERLWISERNER